MARQKDVDPQDLTAINQKVLSESRSSGKAPNRLVDKYVEGAGAKAIRRGATDAEKARWMSSLRATSRMNALERSKQRALKPSRKSRRKRAND